MDGRFVGPCCQCSCHMWLPTALYDAAKHSEKIIFYCPYGHPQVFKEGDSEADILRRERDRLKQQMAFKDDQIRAALTKAVDAEAKRAKLAKDMRRVNKGVCACCNRSFENLQRHMKTKHPDFGKALQ